MDSGNRQRPRRGRVVAALAIALLGAIAGAVWLGAAPLMAHLTVRLLAGVGIAPASVSVEHVGLGELVLRDVRAGDAPALTARRVRIGFSPQSILRGTVDEIDVEDMMLHAEWANGRLSSPVIDALLTRGRGAPTAAADWDRLPAASLNGAIALVTPLGAVQVELDASMQRRDDGATLRAQAIVHHEDGQLAVDVELDAGADGRVEARIASGGGSVVVEHAALDLERLDAKIVRGPEGLELVDASAQLRSGRLRDLVIETAGFSAMLDGRSLRSTLTAVSAAGNRLSISGATEDVVEGMVSSQLAVALAAADELADLGTGLPAISGALRLDGDFELRATDLLALASAPRHWPRGRGRLVFETKAARWSGLRSELSVHGTLDARVSDGGAAAGRPGSGRQLTANGVITTAGDGARLSYELEPLALSDPDAAISARAELALSDPAALAPLLPNADVLGRGTVTMAYRSSRGQIRTALGSGRVVPDGKGEVVATLRGVQPAPTLSVDVEGALDVDVDQGALAFTTRQPLALRSVADADVAFSIEDATLSGRLAETNRLSIDIARATVRDTTEPPFIGPLVADGTMTLGAVSHFELRLSDPERGEVAEVSGQHDRNAGRGEVRLTTPVLQFGPQAHDPTRLVPALRGIVTAVRGDFKASGELSWGVGGVRSAGVVTSESLDLQTRLADLRGVRGSIRFSSLLPPRSEPDQVLEVALFDPGLPLQNGIWRFELLPHGRVSLQEALWPWSGGTLRIAPTVFSLGMARQDMTLNVEDVDLAQLFALFEVERLEATGRISGQFPVFLEGGDLEIRGGRLTAHSPGGTIRYAAPPGISGGETALLSKALEDFRYQGLDIDVDGKVYGELNIRMHIRGSNPELYDGYPIELNVGLEGALGKLLQQGLVGYRIPESIQRRFSMPSE